MKKHNLNGSAISKPKGSEFKSIVREWWLQLLGLSGGLVAMNVVYWFGIGDIYVGPFVWYAIQAGLAFGIFSIFKWGGTKK